MRNSKADDNFAIGFALFWLAIWAAGFVGWIMNIWKVAHLLNDPITAMFVARCVGVVALPLGAVLGFF